MFFLLALAMLHDWTFSTASNNSLSRNLSIMCDFHTMTVDQGAVLLVNAIVHEKRLLQKSSEPCSKVFSSSHLHMYTVDSRRMPL